MKASVQKLIEELTRLNPQHNQSVHSVRVITSAEQLALRAVWPDPITRLLRGQEWSDKNVWHLIPYDEIVSVTIILKEKATCEGPLFVEPVVRS